MANSLGSLRVSLGLDAAEFTRGLTKADVQAQQFSRNVSRSIQDIAKVIGSLEIGRQVLESTKAIIGEAAALNDLAGSTGSSVEALSRLSNQAKIAGTDFATMQAAVLKLSQGMAGTDEESTKAKEALKLLGVTTRDPVQALQEVAVKLATYADGVNKVGLATALFGKQGAQFLATLQDISALQDVAATVTTQQAEAAEKLKQSYRRLSVESLTFKNAILNDVVPALNAVIDRMNIGVKVAGSFGQGLEAMLSVGIRPGAIADQLGQVEESLKRLKDEARDGKFSFFGREETINSLEAQKAIILRARQQRALANATFSDNDINPRDRILMRKPEAPFIAGGGKTGRIGKADVDEAQRYLDSLLKTQQATLDLTTEETARVAIFDIEARSMKAVSAEIKDQILDSARQIDQAKAADQAAKDRAKALAEVIKEEERYEELQKRAVETAKREADSIESTNEHMREQIVFIRGGQEALDAYTAAKLEKIATDKEEKALIIELSGGNLDLAKAYREGAAALRVQRSLLGDTRVAETLAAETKAIKELQGQAFDIAGRALEDFAINGKSAGDVLKQLERDILRFVSSEAMKGLKDALLGTNSGPNLFGIFANLAASYFGGGSGVAGIGGFSGGGNGEHFASGGVSRGGLALVGENGPELRELAAGDRIYSNADTKRMWGGKGDVHVHQNFNVQGQVDTRTARQMAREAGGAVSAAGSRG